MGTTKTSRYAALPAGMPAHGSIGVEVKLHRRTARLTFRRQKLLAPQHVHETLWVADLDGCRFEVGSTWLQRPGYWRWLYRICRDDGTVVLGHGTESRHLPDAGILRRTFRQAVETAVRHLHQQRDTIDSQHRFSSSARTLLARD